MPDPITIPAQASGRLTEAWRRCVGTGRFDLALRRDYQDSLALVQKDYKIDDKRLYLTGLSMGGAGTWSLAAKYPDRWAAIVPICGGGDPEQAKAIKDLPCWVFQGDADNAGLVDKTRKMVDALKAAGGKPTYTEYAGIGHNSWEMAYNTPALYEWLLAQHK